MDDDGGVLGRLPRSRPGTRSEKRSEAEARAKKSPPSASRPAGGAARAASAAEQRGTRAARPAKGAPRAPSPPADETAADRRGDPITDALRTTAKVAEGGVKLAGGLTRELLRRLPRP
jgi:hypothetical protein